MPRHHTLSCNQTESAYRKILAIPSNNSLKTQFIKKLESTYDEDQDHRIQQIPVINKYGMNSKEAQKDRFALNAR